MVSGCVKHIPSLLAEKILQYVRFSHHKSQYMLDFWLGSVQKRRIFFFLATLPSQKIVKEIAYILTSYQALLKAHFSIFFSYSHCL